MIDCIERMMAANSAAPTGAAAAAGALGAVVRSRKHATMGATSASPLSRLVMACDRPLVRCPRHRMAVNTTTVAAARELDERGHAVGALEAREHAQRLLPDGLVVGLVARDGGERRS